MKAKTTLAIGGLAAAGGGALLLRLRQGGGKSSRWAGRVVGNGYTADGTADRWHTVTVNRPPEEVAPEGRLPGPLAELGDKIEVRFNPAPGDRGTEISARVRDPVPSGPSGAAARIRGEDPRQKLREALRDSQSVLETGEVLSPDKPPTTKDTPGGRLMGLATGRARGEGLL